MNYKEFEIQAKIQIYNMRYNQMDYKYILVSTKIYWMLMAIHEIEHTKKGAFYHGIQLLAVYNNELIDKNFIEVI